MPWQKAPKSKPTTDGIRPTLSPTANPSIHTMTHASSIVSHLRSVALNVPDLAVAEAFFTQVWHLDVVSPGANGTYLRGTGTDHQLISLHAHTGPASVRCGSPAQSLAWRANTWFPPWRPIW